MSLNLRKYKSYRNWLINHIFSQKTFLLLTILGIIVVTFSRVVIPVLIGTIIDNALISQGISNLIQFLLIFLLIYFIRNAMDYLTMMFGHFETVEERLEHLRRLRTLQDRTSGFTAFIPWPFQPDNTSLYDEGTSFKTSGWEYLRMLALSRIYLDNFDNIQASWVTQGPKVAQLSLHFGANDFGSTMIEENVVAAAGVSFSLSEREICRLVSDAGFVPQQRLMDYTRVDSDQ